MNDKVTMLNDTNFSEAVKNNKLIMVDFWAEWCGPCKMLAPIIDLIAQEKGDSIVVAKLNVDEAPIASEEYGITTIPTILFFKNGEIADRVIGLKPKGFFVAIIDKLLAK